MRVTFRESDHTYWLGDKQLISVTQLLKKHGIMPNYSGVSADVLNKAAEKGTAIHKEIEEYIKNGEVGFTSEFLDFIDICEKLNFEPTHSEVLLPKYDIPDDAIDDYIYAGTADIIGMIDSNLVLADIKTTAKVDKRAYAWQLSLYERLTGTHFDQMYIFHLRDDKSTPILIEHIPDEEIDKLLECERTGKIYSEPNSDLIIPIELLARAEDAERELARVELLKKEAESTAKEFRQALYELMEQQNIASWETLDKSMLITRVAPVTKTTIDSTKLKMEMPDIAEKYAKTSTASGYVRITIR